MGIRCEEFGGLSDGRRVERWILEESGTDGFPGIRIAFITYGAAIQSLAVPDGMGGSIDVVTGFDTVSRYEESCLHFGAAIGRCCNRIRGGRFLIDGREYALSINSPPHHIHGGFGGLDKKLWIAREDGGGLVMACCCEDGEDGYPGNLKVEIRFTLRERTLCIQYMAWSDKDTLCNLTNHTYFNLNGHGSGPAVRHKIQIPSQAYVPMNQEGLPLDLPRLVEGTEYDMRRLREIATGGETPRPLSACYLPDGEGMREHAVMYGEKSGIVLNVRSNMPALQYYTGYLIPERTAGKGGVVYGPCQGICLETQYVPDAVNLKGYLAPVLRCGQMYRHETEYSFEYGMGDLR